MPDFVNPYAFVGPAAEPSRDRPAGHDMLLPANLSGRLTLVARARTPLLLGGFGKSGEDIPRRLDSGAVMIPGSSLLGAVRSVHEAMVGGCLRVVDQHFVPVHRHPAHTRYTKDLQLAVVKQVDDTTGRPTRLSLCSDPIWIDRELLDPSDGGKLPATGDRFTYTGTPVDVSGRMILFEGTIKITSGLSNREDGTWVLLMTDTRARTDRAHFAAGRPGAGTATATATVTDEAWDYYLQCVRRTEDMRERRQDLSLKERRRGQDRIPIEELECQFADVPWPPPSDDLPEGGPSIGRRLRARPYLRVGQPVWVRVKPGEAGQAEVVEIRLSQLWRRKGTRSIRERNPGSCPCSNPENLCWSCRIFGSADVTGIREVERSVQRSYRGHVRIEDMVCETEPKLVDWTLAPLASPKPSAGQVYLDASNSGRKLAENGDLPGANWGSVADDSARPIAGRKFYWRTERPTEGAFPRGRKREHHNTDKQTRTVRLIPAGTEFTGTLTFDNLSRADLGSLVAALDPRRLWPAGPGGRDRVISLGGGKPFGFGSVTIDVEIEFVDNARSRYLGEPLAVDAAALRDSVVSEFRAAVPAAVRHRWPALRNLLTLGYVSDDLVWYPPGTGHKGGAKFDRGFDFWQESAGVRFEKKTHPLRGLPDPAGSPADQVMSSVVVVEDSSAEGKS